MALEAPAPAVTGSQPRPVVRRQRAHLCVAGAVTLEHDRDVDAPTSAPNVASEPVRS
jgi:hypothetical protein